MKLFNAISSFFNSNAQASQTPQRRHIKDVKLGEDIQIEWYRIKGEMGWLKCINNDPAAKKILLEITWSNYQQINCEKKEKIILDYNSKELKNFNLLNPIKEPKKEAPDNKFEIKDLKDPFLQ